MANAYREKQLAGIALAIFGVLVLVEGSLGGEHVPLVGFMLTLAAALSWACGNFQQKNHVPGDPPANHIAGGVERIDPGAAVYVCLVADRWPAAHAGESTPDRYADGSRFYLAFIATLVGYGIWGSLLGRYENCGWRRCRCWCRQWGWASAALLLGETLSGLQLAGGGADHGRALYQRFRSASGAAWHGARVKAPETGLYTSMRVMGITGRAVVVRHAKFVRFIIAGRHMIEIKRRVVMFRRENHCVTLVLPHRRGGLLRIAEADASDRRTIAAAANSFMISSIRL